MESETGPSGLACVAARQMLHDIIDRLPDDDLPDALEYLSWILREEDTLTPQEFFRARDGADQILC